MTYEKAHDDWWDRKESLTRADARVCSSCVVDADLWGQVEASAEAAVCDFCGASSEEAVTLEDLAAAVLGAVGSFYTPLGEANTYVEDDGEWTVPVYGIAEVAGGFIYGYVASDVELVLEDFVTRIDDADGWVGRGSLAERRFDWESYEWESFAVQTRSSGLTSQAYLDSLSPRTRRLLETVVDIVWRGGAIKTATVSPLWRGRLEENGEPWSTAKALGSPPAGVSPSENRLTPAGASVFYASTTVRGVVIELVQDRGGKDLPFSVGRFSVSHETRYLDVFEIETVSSPYSDDAVDVSDAHAFLRQFARSVSKPKPLPGERRSHYLPTQVFAEVLRHFRPDAPVEAVRYRSSLDSGSENWMFFVDDAHCVEASELPVSELSLVLEPGSPRRVNGRDSTG